MCCIKQNKPKYRNKSLKKKNLKRHLARRDGRAKPNKPRNSLLADIEGGAPDLSLVDLVDQNGGQHADDDLILLLDLGESAVECIEIGSSDES